MEIKIVNSKLTADHIMPKTLGSAGIDLYATSVEQATAIRKGETLTINTGMRVAVKKDYMGLIVPRSSTGIQGFSLANTVGVIDSDYRGDVMIVLQNTSSNGDILVMPMQRIAQLVIVPVYHYSGYVKLVDDLDSTERGVGGFGSTGRF